MSLENYRIVDARTVMRLPDRACIPADPANKDWRVYLAWLAVGNTPLPADAADEGA